MKSSEQREQLGAETRVEQIVGTIGHEHDDTAPPTNKGLELRAAER